MRGGRGQVTLFFAVGLVMLIFLLIIFLAFPRGNPGDGAATTVDVANNAVLNQYVSSCLDTVVNSELRKLGGSGALLDTSRYPNAIVGNNLAARNVLYGITRNRDCNATGCAIYPMAYTAPRYPDDNVDISNATINPASNEAVPPPFPSFVDGYFGDVNFPAVCDASGANRPNGPLACKYYYGINASGKLLSSPPGTPGPSTEEYLLSQIKTRVQNCADLTVFSRATGSEVVNVSPPTVNITFTPEAVLVLFDYPVTLQGHAETTMLPIQRRYDVRYLSIAQFAFDLAREETRNVTFNLTRDYRNISSYLDGFSVGKSRNIKVTGPFTQADLVTIIDARSRIDNQAYTFSFLVEHRAPMLGVLTDINQCDINHAADPDERPLTIIKDISTGNCTVEVVDNPTIPTYERDWQVVP
jgi:hypothetical protein